MTKQQRADPSGLARFALYEQIMKIGVVYTVFVVIGYVYTHRTRETP